MSNAKLELNKCLWVCGGITHQAIQYPKYEMAGVRARGGEVFVLDLKNPRVLEELGQKLRRTDVHVILIWLRSHELKALYSLLRERKNFSMVVDDWWICPRWFSREAEYILFRIYSGIPVRLGTADFVTQPPPVLLWPGDCPAIYAVQAALLRLPVLATWPLVDVWKWFDRQRWPVRPDRLLYFPLSLSAEAVPLRNELIKYDFSLTGSTLGIWLMRDPYASFRYSFANLYNDRRVLMNLVRQFDGHPYSIYDWRKLSPSVPPGSWDEYVGLIRASKFVLSTGGLHNSGLPKNMEYACLGTPMIGRSTVYEFPWLDDCMVAMDDLSMSRDTMKVLLEQAMDRYATLRENCLSWRENILKLHEIHCLLDMLQAQADGQAIPPGYLKTSKTGGPPPK
jgi:hypothetical protein